MIDLLGITEIVGEPASGKTSVVLSLCYRLRTLYISPSILRHRNVGPGFLIRRIDSLLKLNVFFAEEGPCAIRDFEIDCVVIDGLDRYLYTELRPRQFSSEIFRLTKILRYLAFDWGVKVIVTNGYYSSWRVGTCTIFNRYLGLRWSYVATVRYRVLRRHDGTRELVRMPPEDGSSIRFNIIESGIALIDRG